MRNSAKAIPVRPSVPLATNGDLGMDVPIADVSTRITRGVPSTPSLTHGDLQEANNEATTGGR